MIVRKSGRPDLDVWIRMLLAEAPLEGRKTLEELVRRTWERAGEKLQIIHAPEAALNE